MSWPLPSLTVMDYLVDKRVRPTLCLEPHQSNNHHRIFHLCSMLILILFSLRSLLSSKCQSDLLSIIIMSMCQWTSLPLINRFRWGLLQRWRETACLVIDLEVCNLSSSTMLLPKMTSQWMAMMIHNIMETPSPVSMSVMRSMSLRWNLSPQKVQKRKTQMSGIRRPRSKAE